MQVHIPVIRWIAEQKHSIIVLGTGGFSIGVKGDSAAGMQNTTVFCFLLEGLLVLNLLGIDSLRLAGSVFCSFVVGTTSDLSVNVPWPTVLYHRYRQLSCSLDLCSTNAPTCVGKD